MSILAIVIVLFYFYIENKVSTTDPSLKELTDAERLLNKDFDLYYPETPREVVKYFSNMIKIIYGNKASEEEINQLAVKIRELYDPEFLQLNPEEKYLQNLATELAEWKEKNRRITNYIFVNKNMEKESEIDGIKYAVKYVSFTIQEDIKFTETWKILLRKNEDDKWKILGWEFVPNTEKQDDSED
jgi:hypothetical protein